MTIHICQLPRRHWLPGCALIVGALLTLFIGCAFIYLLYKGDHEL